MITVVFPSELLLLLLLFVSKTSMCYFHMKSTMLLSMSIIVTCMTLQKETQRNPDENLTLECFVCRIFSEVKVREKCFPNLFSLKS